MNNSIKSLPIEKKVGCIAHALDIVGDKWTAILLRDLASGSQRFSALQAGACGISPRTLSQRLDSLEQHKIITKKAYAESPPRVEYTLTKKGQDLIPILRAMADWGLKHRA